MPGPGHEHGESKRDYYRRCQCFAEHGVKGFNSLAGRSSDLPNPPWGDTMPA
jgi:hypothetical protein